MRSAMLVLASGVIAGCGLASQSTSFKAEGDAPPVFEGPVPRAECGPDDLQEPALQGQVPLADRVSGRSTLRPYTCNLELVGQVNPGAVANVPSTGDGAGWQLTWYEDCAYYGQGTGGTLLSPRPVNGSARPGQQTGNRGVVVVDASDPASPQVTEYLTTPAMIDPWESLKVNFRRQLLGADNGNNGGGGPEIDIYDVSEDCAHPKLLASKPVGTANGHEGHWAPDGLTYYASGVRAIGVEDPTDPYLVANLGFGTHGEAISEDGNRAYMTGPSCASMGSGMKIVDTSQIQARAADPEATIISEICWADGGVAQHPQPFTIKDVPYILFVDEGALVSAGGTSVGAARIIDITDELNPRIVSKLKLEVHMPENRDAIPESADGSIFGYQGHYCTVSDGKSDGTPYTVHDAAIVICGYFQSGIRVFDIRNPYKPREIAYYNPPARPGYHPGSNYNLTGVCGTADWASANSRYRPDRNEIWFTSQCNAFQIARFTKPLADLLGPVPE